MMPKLKHVKVFHKWLSFLVGIQLIIWLVTGLYFNLMNAKLASGNEHRVRVQHDHNLTAFDLTPIANLSPSHLDQGDFDAPIDTPIDTPIKVEQIWLLGKPYYHFVYQVGAHSYQKRDSELFNAVNGEGVKLSPSQVLTIAEQSYSGSGTLSKPILRQPPFDDYVAQQNPMWQVDVKDENNTTIYLDEVTGRVLRHVNDDSRLKALMLKLHFMDYGNTGGFNHWLIICFSVATLFLSVTGMVWLVDVLKRDLHKRLG